ncbi:Glu-tRNA(Gln) amidotransferase subunit GatD [Cuniculiplasma sp. SKW4]|uniref:Glu-tRNA(Gln) amidotransferase subunit GatD n=1 Tax=Cuniculiplasma sp. SKW4 TaxID=3400171 RepID=UPI003FD49FD7
MPKGKDLHEGSIIDFTLKGKKLRGVVLGVKEKYINIKLESGYNIMVIPDEISEVSEGKKINKIEREYARESGEGTNISVISTGGTIVSKVDYSTGAVFPSLDISEITSRFKYMERSYHVRSIPFLNILSENMEPDQWLQLADKIVEESRRSEGIVISHGTDTMTYTASALSFLLKELSVPVIMVGSQRSSDRPSTDSYLNMEAAINFAATDFGEVGMAMHSSISDDSIALLRGVRARKMHSSRRDAFKSIGENPLGYFQNGLVNISGKYRKRSEETSAFKRLEKRAGILYFHPGIETDDLSQYLEKKLGVVIMGTGLGHISTKFIDVIKEYTDSGRLAVMTTQCIYGTTDLDVYSTGRLLARAGVTWAGNMLPEAALTKMMVIMGNYPEFEWQKRMVTDMRGEILQREEIGVF